MPIISAKVIYKPRSFQRCNLCNTKLIKQDIRIRLYGHAFISDPPYVVYNCLECAKKIPDKKIRTLISTLEQNKKRRRKMTIDELVTEIRNEFEKEISTKNSWGKNEVMKTLDLVIGRVALKELKNLIQR